MGRTHICECPEPLTGLQSRRPQLHSLYSHDAYTPDTIMPVQGTIPRRPCLVARRMGMSAISALHLQHGRPRLHIILGTHQYDDFDSGLPPCYEYCTVNS